MTKQRCTKCNAELDEKKIVWLELHNRNNRYYWSLPSNPIPEEFSQGKFPFGKSCAEQEAWFYRGEDYITEHQL